MARKRDPRPTDEAPSSAPNEKPRETVRVRGRAESMGDREGDALVVRTALRIEGKKSGEPHSFGHAFRVRLGDGSAIEVDLPDAPASTLVPNTHVDKRWSKLEETGLAAPFRTRAPGPDVFATIDGFVLREGDPVEVFGEVTATAFVEHTDGLREAPATRVAAVRAKIVTAGRDSRRAMDEAYRKVLAESEHAVFEVFPEDALWATTERDVVTRENGFFEREIVATDARIVIAGRVARTTDGGLPRLRAAGAALPRVLRDPRRFRSARTTASLSTDALACAHRPLRPLRRHHRLPRSRSCPSFRRSTSPATELSPPSESRCGGDEPALGSALRCSLLRNSASPTVPAPSSPTST